jgi:orotate phosphoribosyltransferase
MLELIERKRLMQLLVSHSLHLKPVTLSSGKTSNYYFDGKMVATHPEGMPLIAEAIRDLIGDTQIDAVGGPIIGAVPILGALSGRGYFRTFFIRKEPKSHGLSKWIEGQLSAQDKRVIIIDDVATTGGSILRAINNVKEQFPQIEVIKVIVLVDREEGAKENLEKQGYVLESVFLGSNLLKVAQEDKRINSICSKAA